MVQTGFYSIQKEKRGSARTAWNGAPGRIRTEGPLVRSRVV